MSESGSGMNEQDAREPRGVGARLRNARESRGLSIEKVANVLGLSTRAIENLEADEYESLGAPVYVRGYIRKYARFLELPEDGLVAAYEAASQAQEPALRGPWSAHSAGGDGRRWALPSAALVLVVAVVVAAIWAWQYMRPGREMAAIPPSAAASAMPAVAGSVAGALPAAIPGQGTSEAAVIVAGPGVAETAGRAGRAAASVASSQTEVSAPTRGSPAALHSAAHKLILRVHETSWIEIMAADHTRLYYDLAPAGTTLTFGARHGALNVFLGNAAGVEVVINGEPFSIPESDYSGNTARFDVHLQATASAAGRP